MAKTTSGATRKGISIVLQVFSLLFLTAGIANASVIGPDHASDGQNSDPCNFPVQSPPSTGADNTVSCRSTQSSINVYLTNNDDSSHCTFDLTVDWGDNQTTPLPNYAGGPPGEELLAAHTYTAPGIYTGSVTGSVTSGDCNFNPGGFQFSYISPGTAYPMGPPISAPTMLSRAEKWISINVPYNQGLWHADIDGTYRQDCSGFVSMAWDLNYSLSTSELATVAQKITSRFKGIRPGDVLVAPGDHAFLFVGWANSSRTRAIVDEEAGTSSRTGSGAVTKPFGLSTFKGYTVYRYRNEI